MRKYILFLVILFNFSILYSQTVIERIDTILKVKIPILEVKSNSLLDNIADKVSSYNVHNNQRYKGYIYSIEIQKDSLDRGYFFYVGLFPEYILETSNIIGFFKKNNTFFLCTNDSLENGYINTKNYQEICYKKEIAYQENGKRIDEPLLPLYNPPSWIFIYNNKNKELELFRVDFIPPDVECLQKE